jgi:hypothetical protein
MRFIELVSVMDEKSVVHVNTNCLVLLASARVNIGGKSVECCNVTYSIGGAVGSTTVRGTVQEMLRRLEMKDEPITFKGTVTNVPHVSYGYLETLQTLREQLKPKPSPQETTPCNGNGKDQKTEE